MCIVFSRMWLEMDPSPVAYLAVPFHRAEAPGLTRPLVWWLSGQYLLKLLECMLGLRTCPVPCAGAATVEDANRPQCRCACCIECVMPTSIITEQPGMSKAGPSVYIRMRIYTAHTYIYRMSRLRPYNAVYSSTLSIRIYEIATYGNIRQAQGKVAPPHVQASSRRAVSIHR